MKFIQKNNCPYDTLDNYSLYITHDHILYDHCKREGDDAIVIDPQTVIVSMHFINHHTIKLVDHYKID